MDSHILLQGIFPTQGSNPGLLKYRQILYHLSHQGSPLFSTLDNKKKISQDIWVMVESSDKMWSTGEGNGNPIQYSCLENPTNSMKRQKDITLKDELPRSVSAQYAAGEEQRNSSRRNEEAESQSENNAQLWMGLVVEVKSNVVKNNIA